jgi:hypothetical protein
MPQISIEIPFLIADYFAKVRLVGYVPMSSEALRRARWFRRLTGLPSS